MQAADMAKIPLNVRVDPALLEEIRKLAKAENRTSAISWTRRCDGT